MTTSPQTEIQMNDVSDGLVELHASEARDTAGGGLWEWLFGPSTGSSGGGSGGGGGGGW